MRIMNIHSALLAAAIGLASSPLKAADLATHLFPHKDGEADPNSGGNRDSILRVGNSGSVGWITYQTGGTNLSLATGSSLTLYLDTIYTAGTLKVFALDQAITLPETDVGIGDLDYDNLTPVATIALTSADQEKIIRLNLNTLLSAGTFHGLVLESSSGLDAEFGSKDCHAQPLIELRYAFATPAEIQDAIDAADSAAASASSTAASATAAASSATAAATSATASASSATAASSSATSAANSAAEAAFAGQIVLSTLQTAPGGYSHTGIRAVFEKPWTTKTSGTARYDVASTVYSGKLFVAGGYNGSHLATFECYNASNDIWTSLSNLPAVTHAGTLSEVGGMLYSIGGIQGGSSVTGDNYEYDPSNDTWNGTPKTPMPLALMQPATAVHSGKIHFFGGSTNVLNTGNVADHYTYNPSNNTWDTLPAMGEARSQAMAVTVGNKIHVLGGVNDSYTVSTLHEVYNTSDSTWDTVAAIPAPMRYGGAVVHEGKIYIYSSQAGGPFYQYDTVLDSWVKLVDNITSRYGFGYGLISNVLYITAGYGGGILGSTEAYEMPRTIYYMERD